MVVASPYTAEFRTIVAETTSDQKIFDRLHGALRICPQGGTHRRNDDGASSPLSAARHREVLDQLRRALKRKARRGASQRSLRHCRASPREVRGLPLRPRVEKTLRTDPRPANQKRPRKPLSDRQTPMPKASRSGAPLPRHGQHARSYAAGVEPQKCQLLRGCLWSSGCPTHRRAIQRGRSTPSCPVAEKLASRQTIGQATAKIREHDEPPAAACPIHQDRFQRVPAKDLNPNPTGFCRDAIMLYVRCQGTGCLIPPRPVLLQRLHHDPVEFAAHQGAQLRRLDLPIGRDRWQDLAAAEPGAGLGWFLLPDDPQHFVERRRAQPLACRTACRR